MIIPDIPSDREMEVNRNAVIAREQALFQKVAAGGLVALNLGCGTRLLAGFVNVDKYQDKPGVDKYDIFRLPQAGATVDVIFCAHVLEHLPIRHAKMAVREWARVLRPGGKVYLGIPDLGLTMTKLLDEKTDPATREFLMYALFGFQTDPGNRDPNILDYPVEPGQFHTCGYTKASIRREFETAGFTVEEIMNYDGWGTPSVWVVGMRT